MEKQINAYQQYINERQKLLNIIDQKLNKLGIDRKFVEHYITEQLNIIMNEHKKDFFDYKYLLDIKFKDIRVVEEFFNVFIAISDRGKGKSYSAYKLLQQEHLNDRRGIWLRNAENEKDILKRSEFDNLVVKQQFYKDIKFIDDMMLVKFNQQDPDIPENDGKWYAATYYRSLKTIAKFKSMEHPNVKYAVYDEADSDIIVQDKVNKLSHFLETVQRENKNLKLLINSNYNNIEDEIIQGLGVKIDFNNTKFIEFNWLTGTIGWFIPKDIFRVKERSYENTGYRVALASFDAYQKQYSGQYILNNKTNIIDREVVYDTKILCQIIYTNKAEIFNVFVYKATDINKNKFYMISNLNESEYEFPVFTFTVGDTLTNIHSYNISTSILITFAKLFLKNQVKATNLKSLEIFKILINEAIKVNNKIELFEKLN